MNTNYWKTLIDSCGITNVEEKYYKQLDLVLSNSPFYKRKYSDFGIHLLDRKIPLPELPFTEKTKILSDQADNPPYGSNICVDSSRIQRIHRTSGTTNKPLILALTSHDIANTIKAGSKCYKTAGLTNQHTVVHCLNYNMWMGGFTDHQNLEGTGATVIPYGVGNSKNLIKTIIDLKVNAISAAPSYLNKLENLIKSDFDIHPRDIGLKLGLLGTESGLHDIGYRRKLEETWGIQAMNANFGMADVLSIFGSECYKKDGLHFISEGSLFVELLNP